MQLRSLRHLPWGRSLVLGTIAACATLAATASVALAKSSYTAVVTPISAAAGAEQAFNVALTNNTASNGLNTAMITPPQGFTLISASSPQGTIQLQPNKVIIRDLSLPATTTVNITVTAAAPAQGADPSGWKLQAFSTGPDSAGAFLDPATSAVTTPVTGSQTITSDCPINQGCSPPPLSTPSTSFSMQVGSGSTDATVTESVDTGTPMDGPGSLSDPGCAGYTPQSPDWYGFTVTPTDGSQTFDRTKSISSMVKNSNPSTFQVCFGAPYDFYVDAAGDLAPRGTLPDGSTGFVGLLPTFPNCFNPIQAPALELSPNQPAVQIANICANITSQEGSPTTTIVTFTIPAGLQGDPFMFR
jgi:hypothetical protein